ncbi:MAG: replicative DNA helicase [Pseudomonadales bacterium]|nr:replicative DNA helicase [Pseudomonadales bacterium]MBP9033766.1 replicative DNA helicase [Pseudomonadales bacterium]
MADSPFQPARNPGPVLDVSNLKIPPHSIEAEQSLLGGLMLVNETWDRVMELVTASDFYRHEHRLIFEAMTALAEGNHPFDVITLSEHLNGIDELDSVGGLAYLGELAANTPSAANVQSYALIVRERSTMRQLIAAANEIATRNFNPDGRSGAELLEEAEKRIAEISENRVSRGGPQGVNDLLRGAMHRIDELFASKSRITGLSTGYIDLDDRTSGLQRSDLIIVAGRPSMGKTAFAMNLVEHAVLKQDKPVLVFSMEMPAESLIVRMLSSIGRIDQQRLRNGQLLQEDWPRLTAAVTALKDRPLFIDDTPALSPAEVRARARRLAREHGELAMIMIDYLQLMQVPGSSEGRTNEVSEISRSLKAVAKEFKCPVVALSQLNRSLEQRPNKRPVMSDLRESGAIEQDADVIAFIYRDEVYHEDTPEKGVAEIIIGKQRNGPIGTVKLAFQREFTRFENLAHGNYDY